MVTDGEPAVDEAVEEVDNEDDIGADAFGGDDDACSFLASISVSRLRSIRTTAFLLEDELVEVVDAVDDDFSTAVAVDVDDAVDADDGLEVTVSFEVG